MFIHFNICMYFMHLLTDSFTDYLFIAYVTANALAILYKSCHKAHLNLNLNLRERERDRKMNRRANMQKTHKSKTEIWKLVLATE